MNTPKQKSVDSLSVISLLVEPQAHGVALGTATGFCVSRGGRHILVTNWHVLSGRHPETRQPMHPTGAIPDKLGIMHHATRRLGEWLPRFEPLLAPDGAPLWTSHPLDNQIDVAAIALSALDDDVRVYPLDLTLADFDVIVQVAMTASIIGFPFALAADGVFPIWKTGHIATDPDLDYARSPSFLIDATTREGMSGSPVFLRQYGPYASSNAAMVVGSGPATRFLGIYSGRIHGSAEIGRVWKPAAIAAVLDRIGV